MKELREKHQELFESLCAFQISKFWSIILFLNRIIKTMQGLSFSDPLDGLKHKILVSNNKIVQGRTHVSVLLQLHNDILLTSRRIEDRLFSVFPFKKLLKSILNYMFDYSASKYIQYCSAMFEIDKILRLKAADTSVSRLNISDGYRNLSSISDWPTNDFLMTSDEADIVVIVPVYKGLVESLGCLHSVISAKVNKPFRLIVVNDCSPDSDLSTRLEELASTGRIELFLNRENVGFVRTVNFAMRQTKRNVILLNSDTLVFDGWIDNMINASTKAGDIASVTPLSNNATIFSYPQNCFENSVPAELQPAELSKVIYKANKGEIAYVPTAVGFCMFLSRKCIEQIGYFDEGLFGKGYGEENDWCMRALKAGWTHVAALDTYVVHVGGISFLGEAEERKKIASQVLLRQHPDYDMLVRDHLLKDPLKEARRRIDIARMQMFSSESSVLLVTHSLGGGTEKHVQDLKSDIEKEKLSAHVLYPSTEDRDVVELNSTSDGFFPNAKFNLMFEADDLKIAIDSLNVRLIHVHHVIGYNRKIMDFIMQSGIPYIVTLHDYFFICPQVTMIDYRGQFCSEPPTIQCNMCVRKKVPSDFVENSVGESRFRFHQFLKSASKLYVPNSDVAARINRYYSDLDFIVRPHKDSALKFLRDVSSDRRPGAGNLRVVTIGAIGAHKGSEILFRCVKDASMRALPIEFELIGYSEHDYLLRSYSNFSSTGPFVDDKLPEILSERAVDFCFLPSICPETYSYTLSMAIAFGFTPVVFDIGALAERVRDLDWGVILPLTLSPQEINDTLLQYSTRDIPSLRKRGDSLAGSLDQNYFSELII